MLFRSGTPEGNRISTTAKFGLLSRNFSTPMVARGDSVSIGILVVAVVEEAIWYRCTLSFRSLLVDMVHDLIIGSNEQYSWSISGMQPQVHVLNVDADHVFVYVQTEGLAWRRMFKFFGEHHDLFPVLHSVDAWKQTRKDVRRQILVFLTAFAVERQFKNQCTVDFSPLYPVTMLAGWVTLELLEDNPFVRE